MALYSCRRLPQLRWLGFAAAVMFMALPGAALAADPGDATRIVLWNRNYDSAATRALVKLVLSESRARYGDYSLVSSTEMTQARAVRDLQTGRGLAVRLIDVATDQRREKQLRAIAISTQEGLTGYRVCLIAQGTEAQFAPIRSRQDIIAHHLVFGQGSDWPDTPILRANGFRVITQTRFQNLFPMLKRHRFNCFPRSVTEVFDDLHRYGDADIQIEPRLLFTYPLPSFFFVNRNDSRLAARIQLGLRMAHQDGQYKAYFQHYILPMLHRLQLSKRTIIRLDNPDLTPRSRRIALRKMLETDRRLQLH